MMNAAHTPTPWAVDAHATVNHLNDFCTYSTSVRFDGGRFQINRRAATTAEGLAISHANAAYIVKCVNSHGALIRALEYCAYAPGELAPANQAQYLVARAALDTVKQKGQP